MTPSKSVETGPRSLADEQTSIPTAHVDAAAASDASTEYPTKAFHSSHSIDLSGRHEAVGPVSSPQQTVEDSRFDSDATVTDFAIDDVLQLSFADHIYMFPAASPLRTEANVQHPARRDGVGCAFASQESL